MLSDGYIANGAEPWKFPVSTDLPDIRVNFKTNLLAGEDKFQPYSRDEKLARPWVVPGTAHLEHRIGGLEKQNITGNISYDPANHQEMVKLRQEKVDRIADYIPEIKPDSGSSSGKLLVIGWGSTYGAIKSACAELQDAGQRVSHIHLRYIRPFPKNLGDIIRNFDKVIVPEINNGQLIRIIRDQFLVDAIPYNKIMGVPITKHELLAEFKKHL
jgi:2-oxoglutarate ferredoxin oxidoreductase subunit alpha